MTLIVHLLGTAQISCDERPVKMRGYKPLALLAYLLITGKTHSRQHLVDLLFDGPSDPKANLRWTLFILREAIGAEYLLADRQEIAFNFESDYWLDVTAFEAGQLDLYRGDFLEGLGVRNAYRFEDWLFFERERLRGSYQAALSQRLEECESHGDYPAVVETAHQLLRLDNLREDWYQVLMRAYARQGKREAALTQFEKCFQILKAELGVEPVTETIALAQTIKQGQYHSPDPESEVSRPNIAKRFTLEETSSLTLVSPHPPFPTRLIGRSIEMTTLHQIWRQSVEGQGQMVLVEGEPGIGKTRLIEELMAEISEQAFVLQTKCPEMREPLAYTLFVDPLRQVLTEEYLPDLSDTWLVEIGRLLPEVRDRHPNLPQPVTLEPTAERRRFFDAVCTTLLALTNRHPLVFFIDDLQWADTTSLELLDYLSNKISHAPALIISAVRSDEISPNHPLQHSRRAWQRVGLLTSLSLNPLSLEAVVDLLQELTTWPGEDPSFGNLIYRETAGNPLFVVETVASLRDEGRLPQDAKGWQRDFRAERVTIPAQVQTLIEARLNRLDELSQQVAATAAILPGSFTAKTIRTVSGRSELETLKALEQMLTSGLLVEQSTEQFVFSHSKIREVAYRSMSQLRRKLLHRRVAETLEKQYRGREKTVAARLVYHYEQANVQDKTLKYHILAGHAAKEQYAYKAAIEHFQKAVALLKAQEDYEQAASVSMQLGLVQHQVFDFQGAQQTYKEAFALQQQLDQPRPTSTSLSPLAIHPLRIGWQTEPSTLDPTLASGADSIHIVEQLFSGLVELTPEMDVIPDVARRWEVLEEGQKYIFHLRDDVRWSDGVPVTACDFEYAWKRVLDPITDSSAAILLYDIKGAKAFHQGETGSDGVGIQALDAVTLVVELEGPTGYFLSLLTQSVTYPVPRHTVETYGQDWTAVKNIVTNGPFRLENWQRDEWMIFIRNPTYHNRLPGNVEKVKLFFFGSPWDIPDIETKLLALYKTNTLDVVNLWDLVDQARQQHAAEYVSFPNFMINQVNFNVARPPFNDIRVRRAFALATDQIRLAGEVFKGLFTPASGGFVPPGMQAHSAEIGLPFDPVEARRLLAEAGYPEGHHFPKITGIGGRQQAIGNLQAQWQENLGIKVEWKFNWTPHKETVRRNPPHLYVDGWIADYPDPDNFLRVMVQQFLFTWHNEAYEKLIEEARRLTNQEMRIKLYRQADCILVEDVPGIPLVYIRLHYLVKPWVQKYFISPTQAEFWKEVIIEPH